MDRLNSLSLCSGGGGLDIGLSLAIPALRTVCWVEWEAFACEVLASRMEAKQVAESPVWSDLRTFDGKPWRGVVDLVSAGYPCQPFSLAGKRRGQDDPRHLWPHVRRVVSEVEPAICFFENVSGHLSLGFDQVAADLEAMGYEVAAGLFTAEEVGASQRRERLFILAHRGNGVGLPVIEQHDRGGPARFAISEHPDAGGDVVHSQRPVRGPGDPRGCDLEGVHDRLQSQRPEDSGRTGIGDEAVADTTGPRCTRTEDVGADRGNAGTDQSGSSESERSGGLLADADRSGRGEQWGTETVRAKLVAVERTFPPGPDDLDGWRAVLTADDTLSPAQPKVRLLADGLADDRARWLKLFGNGVVPLQAAYAFCSLWSALRLGRTQSTPNNN